MDEVIRRYQQYLLTCFTADFSFSRGGHLTPTTIGSFHDGMAKFTNLNSPKNGYINKRGRVVILKDYLSCGDFSCGYAKFQGQNNLYGYMNKSGEEVIPPTFELAFDFKDGMARVVQNGLYGYIDSNLKVVINPIFKSASDFSCDLAKVVDNSGITGFIDKNGQVRINGLRYTEINDFHDGYALVKDNSGYTYIDTSGRPRQTKFLKASNFKDGVAFVKSAEGAFFIDTSFKILAPSTSSESFSEGFSINKGIWGLSYVKKDGKEAFVVQGTNARDFSYGFSAVEKAQFQWTFINTTGKELTPLRYNYVSDFSEGYAVVKKTVNSPYTYIDYNGYDVLYNYYLGPFDVGSSLVPVRDANNKYGYIDEFGKIVIKPIFDSVEDFISGLAKVSIGKNDYYIDKHGKRMNSKAVSHAPVENAIRYQKKLFGGYFYFRRNDTKVELKQRPIFEFENYILCYSNTKLILYDKIRDKYTNLVDIYNGNASVELGLNYFYFNNIIYFFYLDKYVAINTNIFNFDRSKIIKLKLLDGVTDIKSFEEFSNSSNIPVTSIPELK